MKSLLLGAAGFIGTNLAIELAKNSENELTLVDRNKDYFKTIVKMNIGNINVMESRSASCSSQPGCMSQP